MFKAVECDFRRFAETHPFRLLFVGRLLMKRFRKIFAFFMCTAMLFTAVACGGSDDKEVPVDGATLDVQFLYAGYGGAWLYELGEAFTETYKKQGYKVEINRMKNDIDTELSSPKKNTTDLYFTGGLDIVATVDRSFSVLKNKDSTLCEDLTESFYNSHPIGKDGKEESVKVKDKIKPEALLYTEYYGRSEKWQGKNFAMPWVNSVTGFIVDKTLLKNTFNLEIPVTTQEMLEDCDTIRNSGTGISPVSTAMKDSYNYWNFVTDVWWAQYSGVGTWENFYRAIPADGNMRENGYEVYNDDGMEYAFGVLFAMHTKANSPDGSEGWSYSQVNESIYGGTSVFNVNGDWASGYIEEEYPEKSDDMVMMKTPIISELGVKLRLDGSSSGNANAAKCEEVLRATVRAIDDKKTDAQILSEIKASSGVTLNAEKIEALRVARGIYYNLGYNHQCMIPSFAKDKDVALLFLRFMASDDGIEIFRKYAKAGLPFERSEPDFTEACEMQKNAFDIANYEYSYSICENEGFSVLRSIARLRKFNAAHFNVNYLSFHDGILTASEKSGLTEREQAARAAAKFRNEEYEWAKANWKSLVDVAGI